MKWLLLIGGIIATIASFTAPPAGMFPEPELARIIFFHLPCAFVATGYIIAGAIYGMRYLSTRRWDFELKSHAANEIGANVAVATMLTGILFSKVQWGAWWHWDPRQTSFLIVLLLQGAYFAIRMAFDDEVTRARISAAYSALSLLPVLFLIFVFPRLPESVKNSLHPKDTVPKMQFDRSYWTVVLFVAIILTIQCVILFKQHVRAAQLAKKLQDQDGNLETSRSSTAPRRVGDSHSIHESS